jgi:hypothetical protein
MPSFLLSDCDAYTSAIIPCPNAAYKQIRSQATVSIVSPIRGSSAENGIGGITCERVFFGCLVPSPMSRG